MTLEMVSSRSSAPLAPGSTPGQVIALGAELDAESLIDLVTTGEHVILDLGALERLDDDAVAALLAADGAARQHETRLEFRRVLPPVRHVLEHQAIDGRIEVLHDGSR